MNTKWDKLKTYINKKPINSTITRKELGYLIYKGKIPRVPGTSGSTLDFYTRALRILGILSTDGKGVYTIHHHINKNKSIYEIKKIAYSHSFRVWFNDILN